MVKMGVPWTNLFVRALYLGSLGTDKLTLVHGTRDFFTSSKVRGFRVIGNPGFQSGELHILASSPGLQSGVYPKMLETNSKV